MYNFALWILVSFVAITLPVKLASFPVNPFPNIKKEPINITINTTATENIIFLLIVKLSLCDEPLCLAELCIFRASWLLNSLLHNSHFISILFILTERYK